VPVQDDGIHFDRLNKGRIANTKPAIPKTTTTGIANTPSAETEYTTSDPPIGDPEHGNRDQGQKHWRKRING
jgi:hypothetical protein